MQASVRANALRRRQLRLRRYAARANARPADEWNTPARPVRPLRRRLLIFRHPTQGVDVRDVDRPVVANAPATARPGDWIETLLHRPITARSKSVLPARFKCRETSSRFDWLRAQR